MQTMVPEPAPEAARRTVVYEQPLNERMRTFLRVEFLYQQALYHNESPTSWSSRSAVSSLLEILAITARGDARSDVLKDLERQMAVLRDFQARPGVDTGRLRAVIARLSERRDELQAASSAVLAKLRDSEFLAAIKHRSAIPGGTCEFDLPDYFHWLNLPAERRQQDFTEWLDILRPLCESVGDLLWVTRENARPRREVAAGGSFTLAFDRETPIQLLRITVPGESGLFPEISGSHHRCSIRFLTWTDVNSRPAQAPGDVPFVLTCCT
jgi:cell division protein ZapD